MTKKYFAIQLLSSESYSVFILVGTTLLQDITVAAVFVVSTVCRFKLKLTKVH